MRGAALALGPAMALAIALAVVLAASGTALAQKSAGTLRVYNQQPAKCLDPRGSDDCRGDVVHGRVQQFGFCSISTGRATGSSRRTPSPTIATLKWRSSSMRSPQEAEATLRKKLVCSIERKLAENVAYPILSHNFANTCWHPYVKGHVQDENHL
jgi:hypothetical protein